MTDSAPLVMRPAVLRPRVHLFVCQNDRDATSPLGPGCGAAGTAVFHALKRGVADRSAYAAIWVTATGCMGICPRRGATVAIYPEGRILTEVMDGDAAALLDACFAGDAGDGGGVVR